jgi:hypothetical protein
MTINDETEDHEVRCQPHLLALRMLARGEAATVVPRQVATEVIRATRAVLAEAEAARGAAKGPRDDPRAGTFLQVRLNRLAAAADEAIAAATAGDSAQLRRQLNKFEALTSAIWTVHKAMHGRAPRRPAMPGTPPPTVGAAAAG